MLDGTLAHTESGTTQTYSAGGVWAEATGEPNTTKNVGRTIAHALGAYLIPSGEDAVTFLETAHPWMFR